MRWNPNGDRSKDCGDADFAAEPITALDSRAKMQFLDLGCGKGESTTRLAAVRGPIVGPRWAVEQDAAVDSQYLQFVYYFSAYQELGMLASYSLLRIGDASLF